MPHPQAPDKFELDEWQVPTQPDWEEGLLREFAQGKDAYEQRPFLLAPMLHLLSEWATVEMSVGHLFRGITTTWKDFEAGSLIGQSGVRNAAADAILASRPSIQGKANLVRAAARTLAREDLRDVVRQLLKRITNGSSVRNDVAHGIFIASVDRTDALCMIGEETRLCRPYTLIDFSSAASAYGILAKHTMEIAWFAASATKLRSDPYVIAASVEDDA